MPAFRVVRPNVCDLCFETYFGCIEPARTQLIGDDDSCNVQQRYFLPSEGYIPYLVQIRQL